MSDTSLFAEKFNPALSRRTLLMAALAASASGCYGKFALTGKLHAWNGSFGNKFVSTLLFWVFIILPVYEITTLVDALVFNLIEFWTDSNPMASIDHEDGSTTKLARLDSQTVRVQRLANGETVEHFDLVLTETGAEVRSLTGDVLVSAASNSAGELALTIDGKTQRISAGQLRAVEMSSNKAVDALSVMPNGVSIACR